MHRVILLSPGLCLYIPLTNCHSLRLKCSEWAQLSPASSPKGISTSSTCRSFDQCQKSLEIASEWCQPLNAFASVCIVICVQWVTGASASDLQLENDCRGAPFSVKVVPCPFFINGISPSSPMTRKLIVISGDRVAIVRSGHSVVLFSCMLLQLLTQLQLLRWILDRSCYFLQRE